MDEDSIVHHSSEFKRLLDARACGTIMGKDERLQSAGRMRIERVVPEVILIVETWYFLEKREGPTRCFDGGLGSSGHMRSDA